MAFKKVDPKVSFPKMEEEILKFWEENKIFEKSVEREASKGDYVFYDGPPFATGTPHYGHIVASTMKDVVPRYWTMKGYRVERKWGWDCHGLPIENIAEKELGIKQKKDIEEMGVAKFNEFCRSKVLGYVSDWKKIITRLGRWADMKNAYKTMDLPFMESVWWVFKQLWEKGLIYEGYRSMHICTRCETTLSQQEVAEGYKDIKDLSVIAKFELVDEPGTFILAWTTTPWTLIGNVALAVNENFRYGKIKFNKINKNNTTLNIKEGESYILEESRIKTIFGFSISSEDGSIYQIDFKGKDLLDADIEYTSIKGKDLVRKEYKPLFDYYVNKGLQNEENGWKVCAADFVTTEEGTGVVHIAPAFGEDDLNLGKEKNLPFIQHVGMDGKIKPEAVDFAGMSVKPQDDHQKTDVEIIKYLAKKNLLFAKEKYEHSYPHCWRCDTPLINYATSSWFVKVTGVKDRALELAKDINWSPKHIKEGRFGNWLEGARDWSISRQRYWASVMPIWKCECGEIKVIGSVDEIRDQFGNPNKLFLVRHGEAENNVLGILNSDINKNHYHLTEKGKKQIEHLADVVEKENIDLIFSSPFLRTKETAEIIAKKTDIEVIVEDRLKEFGQGEFDGKTFQEFDAMFPGWPEKSRIERASFGVESEEEAEKRLKSFLEEINGKYRNKNIVIVSHGDPLQFFYNIILGRDRVKAYEDWYPAKGSVKIVYSKKVDLHKHIIDEVTFKCEKCGEIMKRVPDVLDTWFDSGSMPYAQMHYPFENKEKFEQNFPAEFIAEGVDQTRAWFYYLHVISTAIKDSRAYNNVIVNGIVVGEDGKKLSKRLKNYPDPMEMFEKYGADAMRFYLMSSPVVAAENLSLKESDVADLVRGMFRMLWNSYSFFVLYANIDGYDPQEIRNNQLASEAGKQETNNLLDKWIISELNLLIKEVNEMMENYELNKTCRLFPKFIDNLSNWYIRRSRKRFWKSENDTDKNEAYQTLHHVLVELSKLMAPFTPFIAEEIYRNLSTNYESGTNVRITNDVSVHLADFPEADEKLIDEKLNQEMENIRNVVNTGLSLRAKNGIKVRQPLQDILIIGATKFSTEKELIIKEELNIKDIQYNDAPDELIIKKFNFEKEGEAFVAKTAEINLRVGLNTKITEDLKLEGQAREVIRFIQEMRKEAGYEVDNRIKVGYSGLNKVFDEFGGDIAKEVLADEIADKEMEDFDLEKEFDIENERIKIRVRRDK